MRIRLFLLTIAVTLCLVPTARGDYTFEFTDSSNVDQTNFTVAEGGTVQIKVWLQETNGGTTLTTTGVTDAGVKLTFGSNVTVKTSSDIAENSAQFTSGVSKSVGSGSASLNVSNSTAVKAASNHILLGTFTFTGVTAGVTTAVTVDPHGGFDDTVLADSTVIDGMIANASAAITVTAVPEPGSFFLCGLAAFGMMGGAYRARRRRLKKSETPAV